MHRFSRTFGYPDFSISHQSNITNDKLTRVACAWSAGPRHCYYTRITTTAADSRKHAHLDIVEEAFVDSRMLYRRRKNQEPGLILVKTTIHPSGLWINLPSTHTHTHTPDYALTNVGRSDVRLFFPRRDLALHSREYFDTLDTHTPPLLIGPFALKSL